MAFCQNCGRQVGQDLVCRVCGGDSYNHADSVHVPRNDSGESYNSSSLERPIYTNADSYNSSPDITPMLIWAIVNTFCFCVPLGVIAIIFVIKAKGAPPQEAHSSLNTARILNIIGSVAGIVIFILSFSMGLLSGLTGSR